MKRILFLLFILLSFSVFADDLPFPSTRFIETDGSSTTEASIPFAQGLSCPAGEQITLGTDFFLKADSLPPPFGQISLGYNTPGVGLGGFSAVFDSVAMNVTNFLTGGDANFNLWDDSGVGRADLVSGIFRINYGTPPTGITQVFGDITTYDDLIIDTATADRLLYTNGSKVASSATTGNSLSLSAGTLDTIQDIRTSASPSFDRVTSTVATGTAPYSCTSTTVNTNLNADLLDGLHVGTSGSAIPNMSTNNSWSGKQTFTNSLTSTGGASFTTSQATFSGGVGVSSTLTMDAGSLLTFKDGINASTGTTTGTKWGTSTTQKQGWYNATPSAQIAGNVDALAWAVTLGFRAASSNPPLNLGSGALTCGTITNSGNQNISKADPVLTFTDTTASSDDYTFDDGVAGNSIFRLRNSTDAATEFDIDGAGNWTLGRAGGRINMAGSKMRLPQGTAIPATCAVGELFDDTDSDDCANTGGGDGALCICKTANTWVLLVNF